jgi:hypothetical protein
MVYEKTGNKIISAVCCVALMFSSACTTTQSLSADQAVNSQSIKPGSSITVFFHDGTSSKQRVIRSTTEALVVRNDQNIETAIAWGDIGRVELQVADGEKAAGTVLLIGLAVALVAITVAAPGGWTPCDGPFEEPCSP